MFIADKDAEKDVVKAEQNIQHITEINVDFMLYEDYLEDLILKIIQEINHLNGIRNDVLEKLLNIIENHYENDKYILKRKVGILHIVIGPRCFGHLFDEIFGFIKSLEHLIDRINFLAELNEWLRN